MSRGILAVWLLLLAVMRAHSAEDGEWPRDRAMTFLAGRIGAAPVRMFLQRFGPELQGTYYYLKYDQLIRVGGTVTPGGDIRIAEHDVRGKLAATFTGRFTSTGTFAGAWTPADKKPAVRFELTPAPMTTVTPRPQEVIEVPQDMLVKAYGREVAAHLYYSQFQFSSNGRMLAFVTGSPEQAWIYDLDRNTLSSITEPIDKNEIGVSGGMFWDADNAFHVLVDRVDPNDNLNNKRLEIVVHDQTITTRVPTYVASTSSDDPAVASPTDRFEVRRRLQYPGRTTVVDLTKRRPLLTVADYWERVEWVDDDRFVFVEALAHGRRILKSGHIDKTGTVSIQLIYDGTGELTEFQVDPDKHQVLWSLLEYRLPFSILVYDVARRIPVKQIFVGRYPSDLALSDTGALAYSADGCLAPAGGESNVADGKESKQPRRLCIIRP
jgi:hypothetical protein